MRTKADLIRNTKNLWDELVTPDLIKKLSHTMPDRIKECIEVKGYNTRY